MKNILKIFVFILLVSSALTVDAQSKLKVGHINSQELLMAMPERDTIYQKLQTEVTAMENQMAAMSQEYQTKLTEYMENMNTYTDFVRQDKEEELGTLQQRIETFRTNAQTRISELEMELSEPMLARADEAIQAVAKENGFSYILDLSSGAVLFFADDTEDIMPLVKTKLGIL